VPGIYDLCFGTAKGVLGSEGAFLREVACTATIEAQPHVKAAFNNVSRTVLSRRLGELGIEPDLVRWTDSFMSDLRVKLVLEGREGEEHEVETGVPQGSPVALILFAAYLSGVFDHVPGHPGALLR